MTDAQWQTLLAVIRGERLRPVPTGFIIDSPWLPNWAGHAILDFLTDDRVWFADHCLAHETFPEAMFLPGFWSEFGMCTEPSAFGAVCRFERDAFPFAMPCLRDVEDVDALTPPDPRTDGLLPFVIKRLEHWLPEIERRGWKLRFAVARGPLNIASFLLGATEFLMALKTEPERMHRLLDLITGFLVDWIAWQRECFPTIDGIFVLDDLMGFISEADFIEFGLPALRRMFAPDVAVKFFHNDAPCRNCAPHLADAGVNLLNFGIQHTLAEMREWTGGRVTLLGNLPPREVLAEDRPAAVREATIRMIRDLDHHDRLVFSCGGGMPPGAPTENIRSFLATVAEQTA